MKITRTAYCYACISETVQSVGRTITASRSEVFSWFCSRCSKIQPAKHGGHYIGKEELKRFLSSDETSLSQIPIHEIKDAPRCERCGERGAELHHWAPKEIFGEEEAELWPKDYLCPTCHRDWHGKINTRRNAIT